MEKKRKRRRADKKKRLILILDGVLLLALIVAAAVLIATLSGKGKQTAAELPAANTAEPAVGETTGGSAGAGAALSPENAYAALKAEGVEAIGWLSCDNTAINYPLVQNMDEEYYMTRDVYGKKDANGAISLDGRNSPTLADGQLMIYGNAMADGSMFGSLVNYQNQDYYAQHPTMTLYTPEKTYSIRIFAAHLASPAMANYPTWFETAETRAAYLQQACEKSFLTTDIAIPEEAQLVSLVTNSAFDAGENSRFVVHGYLEEN